MPQMKALDETEIDALTKRKKGETRGELLEPYIEFIDTLKPGAWGQLVLDEGDSQRTVKRRLTSAAKARNLRIRYVPARADGELNFQLKAAS